MSVEYVVVVESDHSMKSAYECDSLEEAIAVAESWIWQMHNDLGTARVYRVAERVPIEVAEETQLVERKRKFIRVASSNSGGEK